MLARGGYAAQVECAPEVGCTSQRLLRLATLLHQLLRLADEAEHALQPRASATHRDLAVPALVHQQVGALEICRQAQRKAGEGS